MTQNEFAHIVASLAALSPEQMRQLRRELDSKLAAVETSTPDRTRQQRDALREVCEKLDAMPSAEHRDGLTNRDHDRILYTR
jgi:hypothetical protein